MRFTIVNDLEESDAAPGNKIPRNVVSQMVKNHRANDSAGEKLWYAHFSMSEILDLFIKNGLLPDSIGANFKNEIAAYGLKIYLGKYGTGISSPSGGHANYKDRVTTILCNTVIVKNNHYKDMLTPKQNSLLIAGLKFEDDELPYLNQANICPPPFDGGLDQPQCDYDVFFDCIPE